MSKDYQTQGSFFNKSRQISQTKQHLENRSDGESLQMKAKVFLRAKVNQTVCHLRSFANVMVVVEVDHGLNSMWIGQVQL